MASKFYPVYDRLTRADREALGIEGAVSGPYPTLGMGVKDVHAERTGEFRAPKSGEWYLSGAIPEAYRAPNDLTSAFHILRLVKTETITATRVVRR